MMARRGGRDHCGLVSFADGPDGLVPCLFRMRGEMIAQPSLKVGGDVDRYAAPK